MTQHPMTEIQNIQLEAFEAAVYSRDREQATLLLVDCLRKLKTGAVFIGYSTNWEVVQLCCTRFCAAVVSMLADPEYFITEDGLALLGTEHGAMDLVFRASHFGTSDHLLPQITKDPSEREQAKIAFKDPGALLKYLVTYSLRSFFMLNFEETFKRAPQLLFPLYLGMLSHLLTLNQQAQDRFEQLVGLHGIFKDVELPDITLPVMTDVYMYSSYSTRPDRHELKKTVMTILGNMMHLRVPNLPGEKELHRLKNKARPTIVIPLEWFTSLHAMYRCWAPAIRQLRKRFRLVAVSQASAVDEESKKEFDKWLEVPTDHVSFDKLVSMITAERPDMVFYPSIGMAPWFVALASVRLAPIQFMTLGHPATSGSKMIDYVIGDAGTFTDPELFTERIIELPEGALFNFVMRPDAEFPTAEVKELEPAVVRIAVPAMLCKLNARFMKVCQRIQQEAKIKTEFHFFPNMVGLTMHQTGRELREWLPGAYIYERMDYNTYLRFLQTCDIHLSTFPFGGTNSNIDSMKLGIPLVCMEGREPFERFDAMMYRKAALPEWLIAHTDDEYVTAAVRLVEDHDERLRLRKQLLRTDLESVFFTLDVGNRFGSAVEWLYENHGGITKKVTQL